MGTVLPPRTTRTMWQSTASSLTLSAERARTAAFADLCLHGVDREVCDSVQPDLGRCDAQIRSGEGGLEARGEGLADADEILALVLQAARDLLGEFVFGHRRADGLEVPPI